MEILDFKHPSLRTKANLVINFDDNLKKEIFELEKFLGRRKDLKSVSAPVVGISKKIIIISKRMLKKKTKDLHILINPKITSTTFEIEAVEDTCELFPFIKEHIVRHKGIYLWYQDLNGEKHTLELKGVISRIVQHETDHLEGILLIDRIPENIRKKYTDQIRLYPEEIIRR